MRAVVLVSLLLCALGCMAQTPDDLLTPYNGAFKGTYTFGLTLTIPRSEQLNSFGHQVGFCNGSTLPYQYTCSNTFGQSLVIGTLVADGGGNIGTGSTFTYIMDPNDNLCMASNHPPTVCPYKVPSGNFWTSATAYKVGDVIDFGGKTYQAVIANTNHAPVLIPAAGSSGNACQNIAYTVAPKCTWVLLYASAVGEVSLGAGTVSGTYTIPLSNGKGTMVLTLQGKSSSMYLGMVILAPPRLTGQQIQLLLQPARNLESRGSGLAILQ